MASEYMEFTATQRRVYDFYNNVCRLLNGRDRPVFNGHLVRLFEDDSFHCVFSHIRVLFFDQSFYKSIENVQQNQSVKLTKEEHSQGTRL